MRVCTWVRVNGYGYVDKGMDRYDVSVETYVSV